MDGVRSSDNSLCWSDQLRASLFLALVYSPSYSEMNVHKFNSAHHIFTQILLGQNLVHKVMTTPAQIALLFCQIH
jgi:hypothetical protein